MIAISTACKEALISIEIDEKTSFKSLNSNCKHSENILFTIDQMLYEMGKKISQNDGYCVVIGPGSFTGLRIGISLIKGLCAGEDKKNIVQLTTFELMAYSYIKNNDPKENFTCIINGLSGYYFVCEYSCQGEKISEEKMITKNEIENYKNLVGLKEENLGDFQLSPNPQELLELAKIQSQNLVNAYEIAPLYLRKSQAEADLENKKKMK